MRETEVRADPYWRIFAVQHVRAIIVWVLTVAALLPQAKEKPQEHLRILGANSKIHP
jgi:hypothetical protein